VQGSGFDGRDVVAHPLVGIIKVLHAAWSGWLHPSGPGCQSFMAKPGIRHGPRRGAHGELECGQRPSVASIPCADGPKAFRPRAGAGPRGGSGPCTHPCSDRQVLTADQRALRVRPASSPAPSRLRNA
jgi:hypothetical protein